MQIDDLLSPPQGTGSSLIRFWFLFDQGVYVGKVFVTFPEPNQGLGQVVPDSPMIISAKPFFH